MKTHQELYQEADEAGMAAATDCNPEPMVVLGGSKRYVVDDGPCGFAWINIRPGTSSFAKWLVSNDIARKRPRGGGVDIWVSEFNQSVTYKETYAQAFAKSLRANGFERAYADSRLD